MKSKYYKIFSHISILLLIGLLQSSEAFCERCEKFFLISTEFQIGKIKNMVERAPSGIYISVGSERSFRGVSMAPNVTHAYLLDLSPEIIRFNKINIELLKALTRQDYLRLRWEATYDDWKKITPNLTADDFKWWEEHVRDFGNMGYPLPEALNRYESYPDAKRFIKMRDNLTSLYQALINKEAPNLPKDQFIESVTLEQFKDLSKKFNIPVTITQEEWELWTTYGKNKKIDCSKIWLENPEQAVDLGQVVDYKTGNYLFDDVLYQKLHNLAIHGQFTPIKIDLADDKQLNDFLNLLKKEKTLISVLDLDNLYYEEYIGDKKYKEIVKMFLPLGQDNSLLIVMNNYKDYACGQFQIYIGFTFENIRQWQAYFFPQSFFDTLPKELLELMNGRVYEKNETPPLQYLLGK